MTFPEVLQDIPSTERKVLSRLKFWVFLSGVPIFFATCRKPSDKLGPDPGVADNPVGALFEDVPLYVVSVRDTYFRSDRSLYGIIGSRWDPIFGITTSSLYTNFRLNQVFTGGIGPVDHIDSVILSLPYAGPRFYGDVTKYRGLQVVRVYELADSLPFKPQGTRGYPYDTVLNVKPGILGEFTFVPRVYDSLTFGSQKEPPQLRIRLANSFGMHLLTGNPAALADDKLFRDFFKGLYIQASPAQANGFGALLFLNVPSPHSYLRIYFNDTSVFELGIRESNVWVNQFLNQYQYSQIPVQGDSAAGHVNFFMQPHGGWRLKIRASLPAFLLNNPAVAINKAEIILPVDQAKQGTKPLPSVLGLLKMNEDGSLSSLPDAPGSPGYVPGLLDDKKKRYIFTITNHMIEVKREGLAHTTFVVDYPEFKASRAETVVFTGYGLFPSPEAPRMRVFYSYIQQ
ncbi:MAG: DUF4270 domain-containing protein [Flavobacteriales bacterium]|nr:DUF4270 domain-containing protein [Flavobacteriales bacterium]MCX7769145.1 DUF4270 domain-containing protein [Flavobacteriales bacterium]MDW8410153.1 DUF4270 family protein [Flavobacteriales bacterium]